MNKKVLLRYLLYFIAIVVIIQFIPVNRSNPRFIKAPKWDSPRTEQLARRACFDCHSNETKWPKYSYIAPFSWFLAHHVESGREYLNFSEYKDSTGKEAAFEVKRGTMPLAPYLWLHPDAKLSNSEKLELIKGLEATFGKVDESLHQNRYSN